MQHSVQFIGRTYSEISLKRGDKELFKYDDFMRFANNNQKKYSLIKNGDDFLVSTWYSDALIEGYKRTL